MPAPARRPDAATERGATLPLVLLLLLLGSLMAMSLLFSTDVDLRHSRYYADDLTALADTDSAVEEVLWRLNLPAGTAAPPTGPLVTVNSLVAYDARLDYDEFNVLQNFADDDGDGTWDDFDEIALARDWTVRILLTPTDPAPGPPYELLDTDPLNAPWGSLRVEPTIQPASSWRAYTRQTLSAANESLVLKVRFKLDTDTTVGDSESDGAEIVYYDPALMTNGVDDKNTLNGLGGDGDATNDSPYNITWSDGTDTYPGTGTPVLLVDATADVTRGGQLRNRVRIRTEVNRRFRRTMDKALCACEHLEIAGGTIIDSYRSSEGDYVTAYDNGDIGSNDTIRSSGSATVRGSTESNGVQDYNGTVDVIGDATSGDDVTGSPNIGGTLTTFESPAPVPCSCNDPDAAELVTEAMTSNENAEITRWRNCLPCQPLTSPALGTSLTLHANQRAIFPGGDYYFDSIAVNGAGAAIMVGQDLDGDGIVDAPPTEPVRIHVSGDVYLGGSGLINQFEPEYLWLISSASDSNTPKTEIDIAGTSDFRGLIYAPYTTVTLTGTSDFKGAAIGKTIRNPGGGPVHRDEDLADRFLVYGRVEMQAWQLLD